MERNILIPEADSYPIGNENGWTKENFETVKIWQNDIKKSVFIYQYYLDNISKNLNISLTLILILSSLTALSTILNVLLGFLDIRWVAVGFGMFNFISSATITIITGIVKLNGWENQILVLSKYLQNLEGTWFNIEIELRIAPSQRQGAEDFIKRLDGEYLFLMRSAPPMNLKNYEIFNLKYKEFLNDKIEEITV